jgi:ABC-2 type transport system ATP-binding protein
LALIEVNNVSKTYLIAKNQPGLWGTFKSLFSREYLPREAVRDISFAIERGELVGYIGPNGAGKSTTIKMMAGVLYPTAGSITVGGLIPYKERKRNAKTIGVVFGQRSQLYWDLPIRDTFELHQKLYNIPEELYRKNCSLYIDMFELSDVMEQPARQLSLGQKMKANLALAMLHNPDVLYLDEPTIGLDVNSKRILQEGIRHVNHERNITVILTSHDMSDIETVCSRLMVIDKGTIRFDGSLASFKKRYDTEYWVTLSFGRSYENQRTEWQPDARFTLIDKKEDEWIVRVDKGISIKSAFTTLINLYNPENIAVKEQSIEDIIVKMFDNDA